MQFTIEIDKKKVEVKIFENRAQKSSKNHENDQTSNASKIIGNGSWDYPKVFLGSLEAVWATEKKIFVCDMICDFLIFFFFTYMVKFHVKIWGSQIRNML